MKYTAAHIRQTFLEFFAEHGHSIVPSSSLVVSDDPTLLFSNSGMVQFKNLFLGLEQRPYSRATTAQKCLRVSGKHNDLEEVGPSPRHHTFFEMMGNFSFGDYFKADAIQMAWELLVRRYGLPVERLWFTVFRGNENVPADDDAADLWVQVGASPERVLRFGEKDNFWVMADTGPCGPCSEITMYIGDDLDAMHAGGVNSDDPNYVEIWNLVFMQFERSTMQPLPRPSVDTGMGLERMAMVLQGVHSTYETDVFIPIIERTIGLRGADESHYATHYAAYRAVADHSRATAFLIADGVLPGNTSRSYVLRRILRRAVYQGRSIGFEKPFLSDVVATVIDQMGAAYPELERRRGFILETVDAEEQQFLRTLSSGIVKLNAIMARQRAQQSNVIPGDEAFRLKDTDGFPLDLTQKIAADAQMEVDVAGFDMAMEEQRVRSRAAAQFKRSADVDLWSGRDLPITEFVGYTTLEAHAEILALAVANDDVQEAQHGQYAQCVLNCTPFYAESGGQVGDTGIIRGPHGVLEIEDTQRPVPGLIVHYGKVIEGYVARGDSVLARVDTIRRIDIARNHTATHLLHRVLRDILGEHAAQAGSLVAPDRLRFDFTHTRPLQPEQLREIEQRINAWVRADCPVVWDIFDYQQAIDEGAMALFGEKYGDRVRMVHILRAESPTNGNGAVTMLPPPDFATCDSRELCGGTHVRHTGEIGFARIVSEGSIGSGLRRIELVTGHGAEQWVESQAETLRALSAKLHVAPTQLIERLDALVSEQKQRQAELEALRAQVTRATLTHLLDQVQDHHGLALLVARVDAVDTNHVREMGDWLRDKMGSGVIVLGSLINEKPHILAMMTADYVTQGYHAGKLVQGVAKLVGGGGGGRPDMAQAGGKDANQLDAALARVPELLSAQRA